MKPSTKARHSTPIVYLYLAFHRVWAWCVYRQPRKLGRRPDRLPILGQFWGAKTHKNPSIDFSKIWHVHRAPGDVQYGFLSCDIVWALTELMGIKCEKDDFFEKVTGTYFGIFFIFFWWNLALRRDIPRLGCTFISRSTEFGPGACTASLASSAGGRTDYQNGSTLRGVSGPPGHFVRHGQRYCTFGFNADLLMNFDDSSLTCSLEISSSLLVPREFFEIFFRRAKIRGAGPLRPIPFLLVPMVDTLGPHLPLNYQLVIC